MKLVTSCNGLGTQSRVMKDMGIEYRELAATEPKEHAKEFMKRDGLLAEHHFNDIRALIQGGHAPCFVHPYVREGCEVPIERADLFAGGFACQPTSYL